MRRLKKFFRYVLPFWRVEVLILSLNGAAAGMGLLAPYLTKLVIDKAYPDRDLGLFMVLVGAIGVVYFLGAFSQGLGGYLARSVKLRVHFRLSRSFFKKFQDLPYGALQDGSTGETLYKIQHDIEQAAQLLADLGPQIVVLVPRSLFLLGLILLLDPQMFVFILALVPLTYLGPYFFTGILRRAWKTIVEGAQDIFRQLQESISHMYLIKASGQGQHEARSYLAAMVRNIRLRLKNEKVAAAASFSNTLLQKLTLGAILAYGGYQVIQGHMTLGSLSAISIYVGQLAGLQGSLAHWIQQAALGMVSCERLDKILSLEPAAPEMPGARALIFSKGRIEFGEVTFAYPSGREVLKGFNFTVEGGACVALAGPSGSGKTTLINLLLRLYPLQRGRILIDGEDIRRVRASSFYRQIGVVFQEPFLWNDTVERNIRYGLKDTSREEVAEAARIACIHEFVEGLPEKYRTVIGENACKVSEGQKQRIAIARAVIKKPRILVLDEAFSALDGELEVTIMDRLRKALPESTFLLISHRLSGLEKADTVCFLEGQGTVRVGSHREVFEESSKYRDYLAVRQAD
ncbi:MAG: ABC transporter ATP-binding protein/permease [Candidatus Omnitrophica bacterium]|nr:ABC transporter ATP-binding protein/permease [Candidatus Omnitrophota bacterium]